VPQNLLVEWIQRPGEAVVGAVRSSVSVGQRTVEQLGGEISKLFGIVLGREGTPSESARKAAEGVAHAIEDRLRAVVVELNLATKSDLDELARRIAALESTAATSARPSAKAAKPRSTHARPRKELPATTAQTGGDRHGKKES
jgi:hypothetical protein